MAALESECFPAMCTGMRRSATNFGRNGIMDLRAETEDRMNIEQTERVGRNTDDKIRHREIRLKAGEMWFADRASMLVSLFSTGDRRTALAAALKTLAANEKENGRQELFDALVAYTTDIARARAGLDREQSLEGVDPDVVQERLEVIRQAKKQQEEEIQRDVSKLSEHLSDTAAEMWNTKVITLERAAKEAADPNIAAFQPRIAQMMAKDELLLFPQQICARFAALRGALEEDFGPGQIESTWARLYEAGLRHYGFCRPQRDVLDVIAEALTPGKEVGSSQAAPSMTEFADAKAEGIRRVFGSARSYIDFEAGLFDSACRLSKEYVLILSEGGSAASVFLYSLPTLGLISQLEVFRREAEMKRIEDDTERIFGAAPGLEEAVLPRG